MLDMHVRANQFKFITKLVKVITNFVNLTKIHNWTIYANYISLIHIGGTDQKKHMYLREFSGIFNYNHFSTVYNSSSAKSIIKL